MKNVTRKCIIFYTIFLMIACIRNVSAASASYKVLSGVFSSVGGISTSVSYGNRYSLAQRGVVGNHIYSANGKKIYYGFWSTVPTHTMLAETPTGSYIKVSFSGVDVVFENVDTAGITTLEIMYQGIRPKLGLAVISPYYSLSTTSKYNDSTIEICIDYDDEGMSEDEENKLILLNYQNGNWVDISTSVDIRANKVCGETNILSEFIIVLPGGCTPDGDVNKDMHITTEDAILAFKYSLNMTPFDTCKFKHANVNGDKQITPADALCIFKKALGISSCLDK